MGIAGECIGCLLSLPSYAVAGDDDDIAACTGAVLIAEAFSELKMIRKSLTSKG